MTFFDKKIKQIKKTALSLVKRRPFDILTSSRRIPSFADASEGK